VVGGWFFFWVGFFCWLTNTIFPGFTHNLFTNHPSVFDDTPRMVCIQGGLGFPAFWIIAKYIPCNPVFPVRSFMALPQYLANGSSSGISMGNSGSTFLMFSVLTMFGNRFSSFYYRSLPRSVTYLFPTHLTSFPVFSSLSWYPSSPNSMIITGTHLNPSCSLFVPLLFVRSGNYFHY